MALFFLMIFALNSERAHAVAGILPMGQLRLISIQRLPWQTARIVGIDILWILAFYAAAYFAFRRWDLK